jgi:putative nucleotidyltransferase with HDIG domain
MRGNDAQISATVTRTARGQRQGGIGGRRLAAAFDSVSSLPALAEARRRLLGACDHRAPSANDLADLVESDAGLAIAVMRAANNGSGPPDGAAGVRDAVEALRTDRLRALVDGLETYDLLERPGIQAERHERFRRHAVAVRAAAERIAELTRLGQRDQLAVAALLHDIGRPVLAELHGDEYLDDRDASPDDRVRRERLELGIDHALVGAVLLRRWSLPDEIAGAVERHHAPDATGHAAAIRLADLIVHHAAGGRVPADSMREPAAALGMDDGALNALIFDFPHAGTQRRRASEPCPLSVRELDALRGLAEGKVYKQIAHELSLSVSTVRTHLHNVYRKIGAVDRAQAVLIARDRGWL